MTLRLDVVADDGAVVTLRGREALAATADDSARVLHYATRTGALVRLDGNVCGAFDREHVSLPLAADAAGTLSLEVEHRSLPTTGLPSGDGPAWRWYLARAVQTANRRIRQTRRRRSDGATKSARNGDALSLIGHSHLDVAWLWTYEEAARKAMRTFATAVRQLEANPAFVYTQSQPQLYAFVAERDPAFFERIRTLVKAGRLDASGAALWVEPDCNLPSGESLLRQLIYGIRYVEREFGLRPTVAWLPDSFGFPNTLPTLLGHAGVDAFATTKLGWNDTTVFPYAQFAWDGPDGTRVLGAQIASIAGGFARRRVRDARRRGDLLLVGEGDGGGGARDDALAQAPSFGEFTSLRAWFARLRERANALPVVRDELYLETHRGTLTTHHDVKARNAALERAFGRAELALAWAHALHATPFFLDEARAQLAEAWTIALRAQFHDVLPGTAVAPVYADVHREYDAAEALTTHVTASARSILPHARIARPPVAVAPSATRRGFVFESDALVATVARDGTLVELRVPGGPNLVRRANRLALYGDHPRRWDAWNVDRSYRRHGRPCRVTGCDVVDDGLEIRYAFGKSLAIARIALDASEPFLRVDLAVAWHERHALLRVENTLGFGAKRARFGSPHGCVERGVAARTRAERAKFEAPGQRFARLDAKSGDGLAVFTRDTYGWSLRGVRGATEIGHSLLRGTTWPDPDADRGEAAFSLAYAP
ncbi:MAG: alpha-mannosidase, partial [Candidatus Eremiobacteraeota bacterium]|nr:alpha-mannosidase [Candidatus Eremiobacteraeota bacterium]